MSNTNQDRATNLALKRLRHLYPDTYLKILNEARAEMNLPPLASPNKWEITSPHRCGVYGHPVDCQCDLRPA